MANGDDVPARQESLSKCASALNQDKSKAVNEKIDELWQLLSAAKASQNAAAEMSSLRWLLQQMDGPTEAAEQVRRYPLSWAVLGCLFERISLFDLSRIFLERRFLAVVQAAATDMTKPAGDDEAAPHETPKTKKRKRQDAATFDLHQLRSRELCFKSAQELFGALGKLVSLLDETAGQTGDNVATGAEHVQNLFRNPPKESRELVAPLLMLCDHAVDITGAEIPPDLANWIEIMTSIWNLHMASKDDTDEFSTHLLPTSCRIIGRLGGLLPQGRRESVQTVSTRWSNQLKQFTVQNLINAAETTYAITQTLDSLKFAMVASGRHLTLCARVVWNLALAANRPNDPESKRAYESWSKSVFDLLLEALEDGNAADTEILSDMLDNASLFDTSPEPKTLQRICTKYALKQEVQWELLAKVLRCDSDLFVSEEQLLSLVLDQTNSLTMQHGGEIVVVHIINPLMQAFNRSRNLTGFVETWFLQLAKLEKDATIPLTQAVWTDARIRQQFADLMQNSLSTKQVLNLLDWLESHEGVGGGPGLVVLDALCYAITQDDYIDAVGSRIFDLAFLKSSDKKLPEVLQALRWRIAGMTASWLTAEGVHQIWSTVKKGISKVLDKGSFAESATSEAFSCLGQLCLANYPGGRDQADLSKLLCSFAARLNKQLKKSTKAGQGQTSDVQVYAKLAFSVMVRLAGSSPYKEDGAPEHLAVLLQLMLKEPVQDGETSPLLVLIEQTLQDEDNSFEKSALDLFLDAIVGKLDDLEGWEIDGPRSNVSILLAVPSGHFTKERRKCIMSSWKRHAAGIAKLGSSQLILSLLVKVMQQPTFYDDIKFDDVLGYSANLSSPSADDVLFLERLAELMVRQMCDTEERVAIAYLQEASQYARGLDLKKSDSANIHLAILKGAVSASKSRRTPGKGAKAWGDEDLVAKLKQLIENNLSQFASDWKKIRDQADGDENLAWFEAILEAAETLKDEISTTPIDLASKTQKRLSEASQKLCSGGHSTGWKLRTFLLQNSRTAPAAEDVVEQLSSEYASSPDEEVLYRFLDSATRTYDTAQRLELLQGLTSTSESWNGSALPCLAMARVVDTTPVSTPAVTIPTADGGTFDLAAVHNELSVCLVKATSLEQFRAIAKTMAVLLDKHANAMKQSSVESTLSSIEAVCSAVDGLALGDAAHVAGDVFQQLCRLVALVIKRHRLRVEGHHHMLVKVLEVLLRVLLANPTAAAPRQTRPQQRPAPSSSLSSSSPCLCPPWLGAGGRRLQARHAAQLARLLTLTCEPSAAAVARWSAARSLDSATDAAKRSAGRQLYRVLLLYLRLQLTDDGAPRALRRALEPGFYPVLAVTSESTLRVLNEALDANGRAVFRLLYADYKKHGKWTGV